MNPTDPLSTSLTDRRRSKRFQIQGKVGLAIETAAIEGVAENLSRTGILFYTDQPVRVVVELEEEGVVRRRSGTLVRCERIQGDRRGWAVEFDE